MLRIVTLTEKLRELREQQDRCYDELMRTYDKACKREEVDPPKDGERVSLIPTDDGDVMAKVEPAAPRGVVPVGSGEDAGAPVDPGEG